MGVHKGGPYIFYITALDGHKGHSYKIFNNCKCFLKFSGDSN